jgi:hypothetical protein
MMTTDLQVGGPSHALVSRLVPRGRHVFAAVAAITAILVSLPRSSEQPAQYAFTARSSDILRDAIRPLELSQEVLPGWLLTALSIERYYGRFSLRSDDGWAEAHIHHVSTTSPPLSDAPVESYETTGRSLRVLVHASDRQASAPTHLLVEQLLAADHAGELDQMWAAVQRAELATDQRYPRHPFVRALRGVWVVFIALLVWCAYANIRESRARRRWLAHAAALLGLTLVALTLRSVWETEGPGDLWLNLLPVFKGDGLDARGYGSAPIALIDLLFLAFADDFSTVIHLNLVLGTLAVPLMAWFIHAKAVATTGRHAEAPMVYVAAAIVAVQPVLIRHSGEGNRQPLVLALALVAMAALFETVRTFRWERFVLSLLAAYLCLASRPEGALVVPVLGLLVLFFADWRKVAKNPLRDPAFGCLLGLMALVAAWWLHQSLSSVQLAPSAYLEFDLNVLRPGNVLWLDPAFVPKPVTVLCLLGLGAGIITRHRGMTWVALSLLGVTYAAGSASDIRMETTNEIVLAATRYWTLALPLVAAAAAFASNETGSIIKRKLGRRFGSRPARRLAHSVLIAGMALVTADNVMTSRAIARPTTVDEEWAFLLEVLPTLPEGATVLSVDMQHLSPILDLGLNFPELHFPAVLAGAPRFEWRSWLGQRLPPSRGPIYFYRGGVCHNPDIPTKANKICHRLVRDLKVGIFAERKIVSRPHSVERYLSDESGMLRIGLYEIAR